MPWREGMSEAHRCSAYSKRTGDRCRLHALKGQKVCKYHGALKSQVLEAKVISLGLGSRKVIDPETALLQGVHEAAGNVEFYRREIEELKPGRSTQKGEGLYGPDHQGDDAPHILVQMYNQERDRLAKMAALCIQAGIAERQVQLAERQGESVARIIVTILHSREIGLTPEQIVTAKRLAATELRQLTMGAGE